jgi:general secretion pathway protein D
MVQIDVTIVDASDRLVQDIGLGAGYVVLPEGSFGAVVDMIESGEEASVRTKSTVNTLSNHPARIQVTQDVVWGYEHVIYYPEGHEAVYPLVEPVGSALEVLPTVYSDNSIKLRIHPSLSTVDGSGGLPLQRSLSTEVIMNNGDTVALGGVESQSQTASRQTTLFGIPLSRAKERNKSRVVMFLTAQVLD